jgi:hypothetical protein
MLRHLTIELRHASLWMAARIHPDEPGGLPTVVHGLTPRSFELVVRLCAGMDGAGSNPLEKHAAIAELLLVEHAGRASSGPWVVELPFEGREPADPPGMRRRYGIRLSSGLVESSVEGLDKSSSIYRASDG